MSHKSLPWGDKNEKHDHCIRSDIFLKKVFSAWWLQHAVALTVATVLRSDADHYIVRLDRQMIQYHTISMTDFDGVSQVHSFTWNQHGITIIFWSNIPWRFHLTCFSGISLAASGAHLVLHGNDPLVVDSQTSKCPALISATWETHSKLMNICYILLYYIIFYYIILHYLMLCYVTLHYYILYYIILYYIILYYKGNWYNTIQPYMNLMFQFKFIVERINEKSFDMTLSHFDTMGSSSGLIVFGCSSVQPTFATTKTLDIHKILVSSRGFNSFFGHILHPRDDDLFVLSPRLVWEHQGSR